ncbi:MAG: PhzF family phenazine biosynthesis protein, partial [Salibacteraceae bacterium]
MKQKFHIIDAFVGNNASGNGCAVVMDVDLSDSRRLHNIAQEFNQPATAFLHQIQDNQYRIRWFAPESEIDLCGHGAMASTWLLTQHLNQYDKVIFEYGNNQSLTGYKKTNGAVSIKGERIQPTRAELPEHVIKGFHGKAVAYYTSENKHIVVFENEDEVRSLSPDWDALRLSN